MRSAGRRRRGPPVAVITFLAVSYAHFPREGDTNFRKPLHQGGGSIRHLSDQLRLRLIPHRQGLRKLASSSWRERDGSRSLVLARGDCNELSAFNRL